ncbi:acyltransferase family protein [Bailinhaonella thermotolerans]|uniref:acyltransferase family protein n=1 Tax=Bailinhaonella thermotolerans TaxID=1070861 RepID=UPI00192A66A5|nr:acyltransferase [Bailinhaonella thermotolerans]
MDVTPGARPRLRELDLLRFVAALAVLAFHYPGKQAWGTPNPFPEAVHEITRHGKYGVDLFFVISGFVILMSVWGRNSAGDFAASRIVRLMPAYWLSVLFVAGSQLVLGDPPRRLGEVILNLTMLQEPAGGRAIEVVYWTLSVELRFYLIACLLVLLRPGYRTTLAFLVGWLLLSLLMTLTDWSTAGLLLLTGWNHYFIGGMALYLIHRVGHRPLPWALVVVSCALAALNVDTAKEPAGPYIVIGIFAVTALAATGLLRRLSWTGLTALGALTYPLYLFHQQTGVYLIRLTRDALPAWAAMAVSTAGAIGLAYLVHRFAERPLQRLLRARLSTSLALMRSADAPPRTGEGGPPGVPPRSPGVPPRSPGVPSDSPGVPSDSPGVPSDSPGVPPGFPGVPPQRRPAAGTATPAGAAPGSAAGQVGGAAAGQVGGAAAGQVGGGGGLPPAPHGT